MGIVHGNPARRVFGALLMVAAGAGCSTSHAPGAKPGPVETPARQPAPWSGEPLAAGEAPAAYSSAWAAAANRATCALVAVADPDVTQNASARPATFSGGWGVAFDKPELRSAFGVAGTGVEASDATYSDWPHHIEWSDGSSAGYGPEGGTGPNHLAYLRITGQGCLYNVWSRLGRAHLEEMLGALRFVEMAGN